MSTHESDRHAERSNTLLESFDSWAQLLRHSDRPPAAAAPEPARPTDPAHPEARTYRPILRKPMAILHVVDDGREDGESIRVRSEEIVIGRSDGDVRIPHDISMSPRHARIERLNGSAWQLIDLGSAGGTFVRVLMAKLKDGSILQIGCTRFRFEAADPNDAWLVEIVPDGNGRRHECRAPATTVGRTGCGARITIDDPFVSPVHAEVQRTAGGWRVENRGLNGLWVKIDAPVKLAQPSQFQCGEQRFVFVPLLD